MGQIQVWINLRNMFKYGHRNVEKQTAPLACSVLKGKFVYYYTYRHICKLNENWHFQEKWQIHLLKNMLKASVILNPRENMK